MRGDGAEGVRRIALSCRGEERRAGGARCDLWREKAHARQLPLSCAHTLAAAASAAGIDVTAHFNGIVQMCLLS